MEYSLEFSLRFIQGIGVLSGDHIKSASDLTPCRGRLLYKKGYFIHISYGRLSTGIYHEKWLVYNAVRPGWMPGEPGEITWEIGAVGNRPDMEVLVEGIPLNLLDTNIADNTPEKQKLRQSWTRRQETRIKQRSCLNRGLRSLRHWLASYGDHMNEGTRLFRNWTNRC